MTSPFRHLTLRLTLFSCLLLAPIGALAGENLWETLPPLTTLSGAPLPDEALTGKVVLVVNVASRCGFTPQYDGLQALYTELHPRGLEVVGVPCNQFGSQEPGSPEEIQSFCRLNYGVTFPLLEKQEVHGPQQSPLYARLIASPIGAGAPIKWNFEKFVLDRRGEVVARFPSQTRPDDPALRAALEAALTADR